MAALGKFGKPKKRKGKGAHRISPLKPGLRGAGNWAAAQVRSARYSRQKMNRMIISGTLLVLAMLWGSLWLGGFMPKINAGAARFTKQRMMNMGFVVRHVDVVGDARASEGQIKAMLGVRPGDYLFEMDIENAQKRIESLSWVDSVIVRRLWPDRIVVQILERRPYALWQNNQIIKVVDRSGFVIDDALAENYGNLPLVVGRGAALQAEVFLTELDTHTQLTGNLSAAIYVSERRWDIIVGGTRIMLPVEDPAGALAQLDIYLEGHDLIGLDLQRIDLRVAGRMVLRPCDAQCQKARRQRA